MTPSPNKSPTKYEDSPTTSVYTIDSFGEKKLRKVK
jgi:hypothetical protein